MRNPFADSYHWSKRIWAPNPFVVLLRKAQTDLAIRIWTILVPIRSKKPEKNGFGPFSYKFFVCIRVGLNDLGSNRSPPVGHFYFYFCRLLYSLYCIKVDALLLLYIIINLFLYILECFCFVFVLCPCLAIKLNGVYSIKKGGFLPGIILLTQYYYHRGTRLYIMKRFCICSL